ncbi:hypothetical protein BU23DRAFT_493347, partial [Bimuria novae-zelandiae CBS 107.79]
VDVDYLFNMFHNRIPEFASPICNVVEPRNARIKKCGIEHPTGQGSMKQHKTCSVTFDVVIPANLEHNPYAVLIMFGTHNHIPPPPHVTRMQQLQDIKNVLHPILTPQLTRAQFLNSTQLAAFLHLKGYQSIEDFSITFANKNRLDRIITKEKLIMFPYGTGVGGVMYQQRQKDQFPESAYIRRIISSASATIIICIFDSAAKILADQETFQMDMSYARCESPWKELLLAIFHRSSGKLISLGRIFTDKESPEIYQIGLTAFFGICSERVGRPIQWHHIHKQGFVGVTVDMDNKQAKGFALYLQSIDPHKRSLDFHIQSTLRFCVAHFKRGVEKATIGETREQDSSYGRMMQLLDCQTRDEYQQLVELLITQETRESVQNWAIDKRSVNTASGIAQCCSRIPKHNWNKLESTSNSAEQQGNKSYRSGKGLSLLAAVTASRKMDLQDLREYDAYDRYGIRHAYREKSTIQARFSQSRSREMRTFSHLILNL